MNQHSMWIELKTWMFGSGIVGSTLLKVITYNGYQVSNLLLICVYGITAILGLIKLYDRVFKKGKYRKEDPPK